MFALTLLFLYNEPQLQATIFSGNKKEPGYMKRSIKKLLIISNHKSHDAAAEMCSYFDSRNFAVTLQSTHEKVIDNSLLQETELAISIGGDGTLLYCARMIGNLGIPILGVNMGDFGFLTEISRNEWQDAFESFLNGELGISERIMVEVSVTRQGKAILIEKGLNDAVICSARGSRLIKLNVSFSSLYVSRYRADGIIIATPTGSTAYSLSAGGPILHPEMDALVINPICPFTISNRPLVIPGNAEVQIEVAPGQRHDAVLNIDGADVMDLIPLDNILVKKAQKKCLIINSDKRNFYEVLRAKLNWSGEPNA